MKYYKKINLKFSEVLKKHLLEQIVAKVPNADNLTRIISTTVDLPEDLTQLVNNELISYGIPELEYCRIYLRPKNNTQFIHVDGSGEILHCAINIPLRGGEGSVFQWMGGDYSLTSVNLVETNQVAFKIDWNSEPEVKESIEMIDGCYLVRIDQPHQAIASPDRDRWVFTIRFKGNPTFDEIYELVN